MRPDFERAQTLLPLKPCTLIPTTLKYSPLDDCNRRRWAELQGRVTSSLVHARASDWRDVGTHNPHTACEYSDTDPSLQTASSCHLVDAQLRAFRPNHHTDATLRGAPRRIGDGISIRHPLAKLNARQLSASERGGGRVADPSYPRPEGGLRGRPHLMTSIATPREACRLILFVDPAWSPSGMSKWSRCQVAPEAAPPSSCSSS